MAKIGFIYFGNKYTEEEKLISSKFVTYRAEAPNETPDLSHEIYSCDYVIMRGDKLSQSEYANNWTVWKNNGVVLVSTPLSYEIANSAAKNSQLLGENAPSIYIYSAQLTDQEITDNLKNKAALPLFVRSEKESAAKYVGVDGCVVSTSDDESFLSAIRNLRENVSGFKEIIFKQVIPIADGDNGKKLEYRVIAVRGKLIAFDYDANLPTPDNFGLDKYASNVICKLAQSGFDGGFFMDFGVKKDGGFFVVECKDLINGTIKAMDGFIFGLENF